MVLTKVAFKTIASFLGGLFMAEGCLGSEIDIEFSSEQVEETLFLTSYATSDEAGSLTYSIQAQKTGPTGSAKTQQSGSALFLPGSKIQLSSLAFSVREGELLEISVSIIEQGEEVARSKYVFPEKD